jgi:cytoskeletal protein CcmA (bactofilin family)
MKKPWKMLGRVVVTTIVLGLITFGLTGTVWAADIRGGGTVVVAEDEVVDDDLFISANRIEVNGTVRGDLIAVGSEVTINGTVGGSLVVVGYALSVNGRVDGSLYGAGYSLSLESEARVDRNLYFGGFSLITKLGSSIGRDLYAGDYQSIHNGEVKSDMVVSSAALEINGTVGGDVRGEVKEGQPRSVIPALPGAGPIWMPGMELGDSAQVGGEIDVQITEYSPTTVVRPESVLVRLLGQALVRRLGEFIALLIVGALLLRFWPEVVQRVRKEAQERPLQSAGWGCIVTLVFYVGIPIVGLLILLVAILGGVVTFGELFNDILGIGGAALTLLVVAFTFMMALVTKTIVAQLGGRWILKRVSQKTEPTFWRDFGALALGAFLYEVLRAIPLGVGWLISIIVTILGLGAIYFVLREKLLPGVPKKTKAPQT